MRRTEVKIVPDTDDKHARCLLTPYHSVILNNLISAWLPCPCVVVVLILVLILVIT